MSLKGSKTEQHLKDALSTPEAHHKGSLQGLLSIPVAGLTHCPPNPHCLQPCRGPHAHPRRQS